MAKIRKRTLRGGNMLNPTPVVMVSCGSTLEEYNIITVAWAGTVNSDPPVCAVSIRPERHSYGIIKQSGAFVINLVDKRLTPYADWCGVRSGRKYNKFVETGLTPDPGMQGHPGHPARQPRPLLSRGGGRARQRKALLPKNRRHRPETRQLGGLFARSLLHVGGNHRQVRLLGGEEENPKLIHSSFSGGLLPGEPRASHICAITEPQADLLTSSFSPR